MANRSEEKDARVKGMMDKMKAPAGKFRSMNIEAADNGVSIRTHREMPPKASDNDGDESNSPAGYTDGGMSNSVHSSMEDAMDHVQKHLSSHFGKGKGGY